MADIASILEGIYQGGVDFLNFHTQYKQLWMAKEQMKLQKEQVAMQQKQLQAQLLKDTIEVGKALAPIDWSGAAELTGFEGPTPTETVQYQYPGTEIKGKKAVPKEDRVQGQLDAYDKQLKQIQKQMGSLNPSDKEDEKKLEILTKASTKLIDAMSKIREISIPKTVPDYSKPMYGQAGPMTIEGQEVQPEGKEFVGYAGKTHPYSDYEMQEVTTERMPAQVVPRQEEFTFKVPELAEFDIGTIQQHYPLASEEFIQMMIMDPELTNDQKLNNIKKAHDSLANFDKTLRTLRDKEPDIMPLPKKIIDTAKAAANITENTIWTDLYGGRQYGIYLQELGRLRAATLNWITESTNTPEWKEEASNIIIRSISNNARDAHILNIIDELRATSGFDNLPDIEKRDAYRAALAAKGYTFNSDREVMEAIVNAQKALGR